MVWAHRYEIVDKNGNRKVVSGDTPRGILHNLIGLRTEKKLRIEKEKEIMKQFLPHAVKRFRLDKNLTGRETTAWWHIREMYNSFQTLEQSDSAPRPTLDEYRYRNILNDIQKRIMIIQAEIVKTKKNDVREYEEEKILKNMLDRLSAFSNNEYRLMRSEVEIARLRRDFTTYVEYSKRISETECLLPNNVRNEIHTILGFVKTDLNKLRNYCDTRFQSIPKRSASEIRVLQQDINKRLDEARKKIEQHEKIEKEKVYEDMIIQKMLGELERVVKNTKI